MTKRKALHIAKTIVSKEELTPTNLEVLEKLDEIDKILQRKSWTQDSIIDALNQWEKDNGRPPSQSDLGQNGLPDRGSIKRVFGETVTKVFKQLYPSQHQRSSCSKVFREMTVEQLIDYFKMQINTLKPTSAIDYNTRRPESSPSWQMGAKRLGYSTWSAFYRGIIGEPLRREYVENCKILEVKLSSPLADKLDSIIKED